MPTRALVLGAAGRDFHDFLVALRDDPDVQVVAFTAAQIPGIAARRFPAELAGPRYPEGIPIEPEERLESLVRDLRVDRVILSYSDLSHEDVMHLASRVLAAGADFTLLSPARTTLRSTKPVVAVTAVRTGCGKGALARRIVEILRAKRRRVVVVRHPMPYGDLVRQRVQRFERLDDLDRAEVTLEEREEYEPHLAMGSVVFAGVDYREILRQAETEADVVLWDGGNNDLPFFEPTVGFCLVDPHRPGHETRFHPGETNLRRAHVIVVGKVDTAPLSAIQAVRDAAHALQPAARVLEVRMPLVVDGAEIAGRRVLAVEDGPTHTHGGMRAGAAEIVARRAGATLVDPRPFALGSLRDVYLRHPDLGPILPAMGYGRAQMAELEATIAAVPCDVVLVGTPVDLARALRIDAPVARVRYEVEEVVPGGIGAALEAL